MNHVSQIIDRDRARLALRHSWVALASDEYDARGRLFVAGFRNPILVYDQQAINCDNYMFYNFAIGLHGFRTARRLLRAPVRRSAAADAVGAGGACRIGRPLTQVCRVTARDTAVVRQHGMSRAVVAGPAATQFDSRCTTGYRATLDRRQRGQPADVTPETRGARRDGLEHAPYVRSYDY